MNTDTCPLTKTTAIFLTLCSLVGMVALATWTFSAWDFFSALEVSDQQVVSATMTM
jgi:hypothetical protein